VFRLIIHITSYELFQSSLVLMEDFVKETRMNRKILFPGLFSVLCVLLIFGFCPAADAAEKKVGVLLWNEEARYTEAKQGMLDQLRQEGFGGAAVRYIEENAGGSKARVISVARKFAAEKVDMIIAIGTSAVELVAAEVKDVPIVFSMVYDPVEAKIAKSWKSSGNNTTGASPRLPMSKLVGVLKELATVKSLAVLYTPTEKNSEIQLKELQKIQGRNNIRIIPVILTREDDPSLKIAQVVRASDAIYLSGSSIVGASIPAIVNAANRAHVVSVTHLDDLVEKGALLGVSVDSYHVGRLAGKKAAKVLRGSRPASIPIEMSDRIDIILNMKSVRDGKFDIPPSFLEKVNKKVE
jgi:putative tryptophan/tyrosine transport system substrate-binding protein